MGGAVQIGLILGATALKETEEYGAMRAKRRALDTLKTQEELKATEEAIQREKKVQQIMGVQRAEGAARGVTPTSASLSAISTGTFNEFAQDEKAANLNLQIKEDAIDQEKQNTKREFMFQTFGNLFDAANRYNNLKVPGAQGVSQTQVSGSEVDNVFKPPKAFEGPLDLKKYNQDELNDIVGF